MKSRMGAAALGMLIVILSGSPSRTHAQTHDDLIFYSQTDNTTTARNLSVGGALGAIGADFSTLSSNPAGVAIFRRTTLAISGGMGMHLGEETFRGVESSSLSPFGSLDGLGVVGNLRMDEAGPLRGVSFGCSFNKMGDYSFSHNATGETFNDDTFLDILSQMANDQRFPFGGGYETGMNWFLVDAILGGSILALDENALDFDPDVSKELIYTSHWEDDAIGLKEDWDGRVLQENSVSSTGRQSELTFSLGANLVDAWYLGLTVGMPIIDRSWTRTFSEYADEAHKPLGLMHMEFVEKNSDYGVGLNLKLGLIGTIAGMVRVGAAFHSPSWVRMTSKSTHDATARFKTAKEIITNEVESPEAINTYDMITPMRGMLSAAVLLGKHGFISVDYTLTALPTARFVDANLFGSSNELMRQNVKPMHGLRAGAELFLGRMALRAGGGFRTDPYSKAIYNPHGMGWHAALGMGYHLKSFFVDLGYRHSFTGGEQAMYGWGDRVVDSQRENWKGLFLITAGMRI